MTSTEKEYCSIAALTSFNLQPMGKKKECKSPSIKKGEKRKEEGFLLLCDLIRRMGKGGENGRF